MADFRFSTNIFGIRSLPDFTGTCRRAERLGYDTVFAADHLGVPSPFPVLVAAANATERLHVGTLVLNVPFWNPVLLAREIATTDVLTGGRLEVGLGAGHMKWEFDEAGIDWEPFATRTERLRATIDELTRQFARDGFEQQRERNAEFDLPALRPVQRTGFDGSGPPLLVGGTGDRVLRIAAEHADIIGIAGARQLPGQEPGTLRLCTAEEADERVAFARRTAGTRADRVAWHALVQAVVPSVDRQAAASELLPRFGDTMSLEQVLETPFLLIGTPEEMAEQLRHNRDRYGFTHYTVHGPFMDAFAPVIPLLKSPASEAGDGPLRR
ncbi:TIGR03621 family F420-dependent LLM class oxidoreductase [Saccharopolyspora rhizosphaerae]|uniref:TIGR03621 family F420-dependent LLM class oxidoreductase n=1 Tax=Saccharopolyspora rhizosphaerae TaxID=2492662 RepID=A0A3R8VM97_9PSEU|nr:TIGR03621 family F420-dependent LLM class oxidoreductase [Saccharopolyspora rhizosphaerae]RRO20569.1 TIGR03621 family F420-dependent LLM class oxidoreductase [Saccharopolyspora rhizosphaerae]